MPTVTFNLDFIKEDLEGAYSNEEISTAITQLGTEVEGIEDDKITVEVFPNRPDYLTRGGIITGLRGWFDEETGITVEKYNKSTKSLRVEKAVENVRPVTNGFIARDCELTTATVNELITIQEKLHVTYGRRRKKCAIGLYDADKIKWPLRYTAKKPEDILFQPLGEERELTGNEILLDTKKGKEYKHLLEGKPKYPVFIDDNDDILSLPPIINSQRIGSITPQTKNIFVECSGNNQEEIGHALHILAQHFTHIGANVEKLHIEGLYSMETPQEINNKQQTTKQYVNDRLGTDLTTKEIKKYLEKARHKARIEGNKITVQVSNTRKDILHQADLVEDIAIQRGYQNIIPDKEYEYSQSEEPQSFTVKNALRDVMLSQGLEEIYTFSLVNNKMAQKLGGDPIDVKNSVSKKYNSLKDRLVYTTIETLSSNTSSNYPQNIFEIGTVFTEDEGEETKIREEECLSVAFCHKETTITEVLELIKKLEQEFDSTINIKKEDNPLFIPGRSGQIINDNNGKGIFGEIHPQVLHNKGLSMPVTYLELPLTIFL